MLVPGVCPTKTKILIRLLSLGLDQNHRRFLRYFFRFGVYNAKSLDPSPALTDAADAAADT